MEEKTAEQILRHHLHSDIQTDNLKRFYALVSYEREIEAMEIYATQEREKAVIDFKKQLYSCIVDSQLKTVGNYEKLFRNQSELLIEKLK